MSETTFVTAKVDAWLVMAKSSLLASSLLANSACASSSPASTSSRVLWGPRQFGLMFNGLQRVSSLFTGSPKPFLHSNMPAPHGVLRFKCCCLLLTFRNVVAFVAILLHHVCYTYTQVASSYVHLPAHYSFMPAIISDYWCLSIKSANSLLPPHCSAWYPRQLLAKNWARSPRDGSPRGGHLSTRNQFRLL